MEWPGRPARTVRDVAPAGEPTSGRWAGAAAVPHPGRMAPATTPPLPGSMTVPPWFGWQDVVVVVVVLMVLGVAFFLVTAAARTSAAGRSEWQAYLEARSNRPCDPDADSTVGSHREA